jgi:hypothetical protein
MAQVPVSAAVVECATCGRNTVLTDSAVNAHLALVCKCCPDDHDHGAAANACPGAGGIGHNGTPCGVGVPGCTVCRPLIYKGFGAVVMVEG